MAGMGHIIKVRNPRSGEYDYQINAWSAQQIAATAEKLRRAQSAWADGGLESRIRVMQQWKDQLIAFRNEIIEALTLDTGRHLLTILEVDAIPRKIDAWCALAPALMQPTTGKSAALPGVTYKSQLAPYPLVGVISPWNFPITLALIDAIPALIAGCAVLLKPSEITPRFALPLRKSIEAVSELRAVFAVADGAGDTGAAIVSNADMVCFTGSVKTGRIIAEAAAKRFIPASLELGGKDPVIVTASADVHQAADIVLRASVLNTGQACQSLERVYVHQSVYDAFVDALRTRAEAVTLNYPDIHCGQIGPLIFDKQAEIIAAQIADARARGAQVLCGGEIETHGGGKWIRPTVLTEVNHEMQIMTEETFGPILPVMAYHTTDEAVRLANDSVYGLSAAVIAGSVEEAESIALQLDAGAVSINDAALTGLVHEAEKNSFRLSGLGASRMGSTGLTRFFRKKALLIQHGQPMTMTQMDERLITK